MTRPASGDPFFEKGLPSNPEAERSILGAILLDNTVCNQAIELLRREDFFLDSHRRIYDKMVALTERGMPIDLITLTDELRRAAEFEQIGGATYIASLIDGVPRTDTIEHYAKIVKQKAMLRRLITASNQIIARAFDEEDDPDIIIDQAEQLIFQIAEDRVRQGFQYIGDVAQRRLEQIEQMAGRPEMITGVPTGFTDFDQMTSGLQRQDLIIIAARPSMGKCLGFDSEIVLSGGRVATIEEIYRAREAKVMTLGSDFKFQLTEAGAFIDDGIKPTFRVTTRLGRFVECTLTHPFLTAGGWQPLANLAVGTRVAVPRRMSIFGQGEMRPCEAKMLGYLIGDGCITRKAPAFYAANPVLRNDFEDAVSEFGGVKAHHLKRAEGVVGLLIVKTEKPGNAPNPLRVWLEKLGIYGKNSHQKFIPARVFTLKRELVALFLNRLFATGGWACVLASGPVQLGYVTANEKLARQVQHLLLRFGIIAKLKRRSVKYEDERPGAWQLDITDALSIKKFIREIGIFGKEEVLERALEALEAKKYQSNCDLIAMAVWDQIASAKGSESWSHLSRRAGIQGHSNIHVGSRQPTRQKLRTLATALHNEQLYNLATSEIYWDEITSIDFVGDKQVYDLTIPETHNFVANDICVHNTALALNMAQYAAKNGHTIGIFSLEMSAEQLVSRLLCSEARVDAHRLRTGYLNREEWARLADALHRLTETQIYIDDTAGVGVLEMRAKTRRLKAERGLDMLIIDYLQLMSGRGRIESRQQEVSQISRDLKGLAKELDVPVIALSQLSRAPEQRSEHRPQLSDLRESGCLAGDSLVTTADSGAQIPIRDLVGKSGFAVWALNEESLKIERSIVSRAFSTGIKPVYRLTTGLGRSIRATANHKFRTFAGWKRLDELRIGERLALPRSARSEYRQTTSDAEPALLGHLRQVAQHVKDRPANTDRDVIPSVIWRQIVVPAMHNRGITPRETMAGIQTAYPGTGIYERSVGRERAAGIAEVVDSDYLTKLSNSDVYWDEVSAIDSVGEAEVFDLTVDKLHNFIANGIIAHNSIEQDADVVSFIFREEVYNQTEENRGKAELIVSKQRNGPTGSVEIAFLKEFTRFENMWRE